MRRIPGWFLILLLGICCLGAAKKTPKVLVRFYAEVPGENSSTFANQVELLDNGGRIWISKVPTVSEEDITTFSPFQNADGSIGAYFYLDDHGQLLLETMSMEQRGKIVVGVVNGRHVVDLLIDKRISDGVAVIPRGLTPQDLDLMRKTWKIHESSPAAGPASLPMPR